MESRRDDEGDQSYIVFDRANGQILGRYRVLDAVTNRYVAADPDEVADLFTDELTLSRLTDGDRKNLAAAPARFTTEASLAAMRVTGPDGRVEPRPRIRMRADRDALEGDGEDFVTITIDVVDERDRVRSGYDGAIKVQTTHGKLSARAGLVRATKGRASVTLTSTRETIDEVRVSAQAAGGDVQSGEITLSFE
jgi:hypothetical protein